MAQATELVHLTLAEWAVLGVLGKKHSHGFALVKALAPRGQFGRIWSVPTPVVYRAINNLRAAGLIETVGAQPSDAGPTRTLLGLTADGKRQLDRWLATPVAHMREVRSELLLKLAVLAHLNRKPDRLVAAQLRRFGPVLAALEAGAAAEAGFDATLAEWRVESARSTIRFLKRLAE
ncbi:MAG: PadR family transcriptional regulator [Chloroflexi bacterium]|nr:PadR family transcriptional regulator [Chloroflexota bacterium]